MFKKAKHNPKIALLTRATAAHKQEVRDTVEFLKVVLVCSRTWKHIGYMTLIPCFCPQLIKKLTEQSPVFTYEDFRPVEFVMKS